MNTPNWNERALKLFRRFVGYRRGKTFLTEDFVEFSKTRIEPPSDPRNWGGVIRRAVKDGIIVKVGYGLARTSNHSPKVAWQRA